MTIKSDDTVGRVKSYEAIVKGENLPAPEVPESFKVLVKEMKSLCLNVQLEGHNNNVIDVSETHEDEQGVADKEMLSAMAEDSKKTDKDETDALDDLAAELGDILDDGKDDSNGTNDLIGKGEEQ
jgi:DNA-directed RNA polymerase subunit beta